MQLSTTFNPVTAFDRGLSGRMAGGDGVRPENGLETGRKGERTGERIVYSTPWLLLQDTQSRKEYLEALERPDSTWDVIKHELYYAHGRWNEDGVSVMATGLSGDELAEFIKEYEDEQETKAREAATAQNLKPDLDRLIYRKMETPESETARKKDKKPEPESLMEPAFKPARLETLYAKPGPRHSMV